MVGNCSRVFNVHFHAHVRRGDRIQKGSGKASLYFARADGEAARVLNSAKWGLKAAGERLRRMSVGGRSVVILEIRGSEICVR